MGMAAPEWYGSTPDTVAASRLARHNDIAGSRSSGLSHSAVPDELLQLSSEILSLCGSYFNPIVLAHLDAALAHELAQQAQQQVQKADELATEASQEGRPTEALEHLAHRLATAKSLAAKADSQAAQASDVIEALGGAIGGGGAPSHGFDPAVLDQVHGAELIDTIAALEESKNAICAVQAQAQALFVAQQRLEQARAGVEKEKIGKGIAQQVALARHESPYRGRQLCQLSEVIVREMPCTMNAFTLGQINEYRASQLVSETAFLSYEDRATVDQRICGDLSAVALLGTREMCAQAKKLAYELDPQAFVKRQSKALSDRYVSLRPAADGMTFLTALIPLKQGVRILATLTKVAESAKAAGDERGKGQIMADSLMHRLVKHAPCDEGAGEMGDHRGPGTTAMPGSESSWGQNPLEGKLCTIVDQPEVAVELVMTDRALFGGAQDPAILVGYEPIPAPTARSMILGDPDATGFSPRVWLKRLFTHPESKSLLSMDSRARLFPDGMKEFLRLQDQRCQTPYCDAPIREYDHIKAYAAGGETTIENGQGLCSDCNKAKEAQGWMSQRVDPDTSGPPSVVVRTPTGHRYISTAPPLPG